MKGEWPIRRLTLPAGAAQTSDAVESQNLPGVGAFDFQGWDVRFESRLTVDEIGEHLCNCLGPLHYREAFIDEGQEAPDFRTYKRIYWSKDLKTEVRLDITAETEAPIESYEANDHGTLLTYALMIHRYPETQQDRLDNQRFKMRLEPIR